MNGNELEQLVEATPDADTSGGVISDSNNNTADEEEPSGRRKDPHQENRDDNSRFSKKQQIIGTIGVAILIIMIIVIPLAARKKEKDEEIDKGQRPTFPPPEKFKPCPEKASTNSTGCEEFNNMSPLKDLADDLLEYSICPCTGESRCCSSDEQALSWMIADKFSSNLPENEHSTRLKERFALVLLYFNAQGHSESLTNEDHCSSGKDPDSPAWAFINSCDANKTRVTGIKFESEISDTGHTASISKSIGGFELLKELSIALDGLGGTIPDTIGQLLSLETLALTGGFDGTVPSEIGLLVSLRDLNLSYNSLTGKLPSEIGELSSLEKFHAYNNQLEDPFPIEMSNLANLTHIDFSRNSLITTFPTEIDGMEGLESLVLNDCSINGTIPKDLDLPNLVSLNLKNNLLSGSVPAVEIANLKKLTSILDLSGNIFTDMPTEIGLLSGLTELRISSNPLNTTIPTEIGNMTDINTLDLSGCLLTGQLPSEIGQMAKLKYLFLQENGLTGPIPIKFSTQNMFSLNLSSNQLNGTLAQLLNTTTESSLSIESLLVSNNALTGSIPTEIGLSDKLSHLNLSGNNLDGPIPTEIGELENVQIINLSQNFLTGTIPSELGQLAKITELFLQNNSLTGKVPSKLKLIHYNGPLSGNIRTRINVSGNNLTESSLDFICRKDPGDEKYNFPELTADCNICPQGATGEKACCTSCIGASA